MKIVIDARESGTSTGRYVDKLIENISTLDHKNAYTLLLKKHRIDIYRSLPSNFKVVECNIKEFSFAEQTKLAWICYRLKADLVHFPLVQHPVLYFKKTVIGILDLTTLRFYNPAKNKYIFWIKQKVYAGVIFIATRKAKHIITISNFVRDDIVKNFRVNPTKVTTTYNSADELPAPGMPVESLVGKKFIMYVGRHQPHKNLPRLISAHQSLLADNPDLFLAIVGKKDATTELIMRQGPGLGAENVLFTGFVGDTQLRWLYENTACYVFPSLSEGFGLPGLEAMVHSAPVASSNATCLPEVYGDAAHYFDPLNVEDIASKIEDILSDNSLRADLIAKGHKQAAKYSWRRMAEQTLEIYQQALNK